MLDCNGFLTFVRDSFPEASQERLEMFRPMDDAYRDWNSKINVISRKDIDSLYSHHVLHSLAIAEYLRLTRTDIYSKAVASDSPSPASALASSPISASAPSPDAGSFLSSPSPDAGRGERLKVLDLGTGGGFPGIPLAVLFPGAEFTLCDSIRKKTVVVQEIANILGLTNVKVVNARAESLPGKFDFVVSRAVASLPEFYPWVRGKFSESILYLKGGDINAEICELMSREKMKKGSVSAWPVSSWLKDEFFGGKFVIEIRSN